MLPLNFPSYPFRFKSSENKQQIFDIIRKKFVSLKPEEWVRQHVIHFLTMVKKYPTSLINVEKTLSLKGFKKRYDVVVFNPDGSIHILVECKSSNIKISQVVFDQIARYNLKMQSEYVMVTKGLDHFYCKMNYEEEKYSFLRQIPDFSR